MGGHSVHPQEESDLAGDCGLVTIDMLPDDILVEIFNFYVNIHGWGWYTPRNSWRALVHVCRRWRYPVFASPRRLDLRLEYGGHRPISEVLDAWPVLPVILISRLSGCPKSDKWWNNRAAALESEHSNRICEIHISDMTNSRWERFAAAMQEPFPELMRLEVIVRDAIPALPDSFLGGSASRLQTLIFRSIPLPSIPKLLSSAHVLVTLHLEDIPDSGCFSLDAMAAALMVMTKLEFFRLEFRSPRSRPDPASRPPPTGTRFVLPALTNLIFRGVYEYLEDLLAPIDAPLLYDLYIIFFMDLNFDVPQLHRLIDHAEEFKAFDRAEVLILKNRSIRLSLYPKTPVVDHHRSLKLEIACRPLEWQLSSLAQVCSSSFLISAMEELEIEEYGFASRKEDMEDIQWVELLDLFTTLKNLYLTNEIAQRVCGALQELSGERVTEVLPALHNLFVDGFRSLQHIQEAIKPFVATRKLSGRPVAINRWRRDGHNGSPYSRINKSFDC